MSRKKLTSGNTEMLGRLIQAYQAQLLHEYDPAKKKDVFSTAGKLQQALSALPEFNRLGQVMPVVQPKTLAEDGTAGITVSNQNGFLELALGDFISRFGRHGSDAVSSMAELLMYSSALAEAFGTKHLFYRGEATYGYELKSRVERKLEVGEGVAPGLTDAEISELRRFQSEFKAKLPSEFKSTNELPGDDSPHWLPLMQHYDEVFGTRLLDISTSPFTGLYFACVGWDGQIDDTSDGIVYSLFSSGLAIRGYYFDEPTEGHNEMDEIAPDSIQDLFKSWVHPELWRIYKSATQSPRELAQDGWFLVKGALTQDYGFGQTFKFRVPGIAKRRIAKELWLAGYTPRRMVRGEKGKDGHRLLAKTLGLQEL